MLLFVRIQVKSHTQKGPGPMDTQPDSAPLPHISPGKQSLSSSATRELMSLLGDRGPDWSGGGAMLRRAVRACILSPAGDVWGWAEAASVAVEEGTALGAMVSGCYCQASSIQRHKRLL